MEFLNTYWEGKHLSDGVSLELSNVINIVRENTCLKQKCISSVDAFKKEKIRILPFQHITSITLKSIIEYINEFVKKTEKTFHFACVIEMLHILYKDVIIKTNEETLKKKGNATLIEDLLALSIKCLEQPSLISPIPLDIECVKEYKNIIKGNISLTFSCFQFYLDILFTNIGVNNHMQINKHESRISSLEEPSHNQKIILKRTASKALILACSRLGDQPWTNIDLKKICYDVIRCIKLCSKHDSYSNLLSGLFIEGNAVLFQKGLFGNILTDLVPYCRKETWKKNIPSMHALIWCLKKVKYPHLSQHIVKLVPALLLLTDDYIIDNKLLGILSLTHLISNVNPAELKLYNHDAVIYDVLMLQMFLNQHDVYDVTLTCLLQLLHVLHNKPNVINGIKYTHWDTTFEKVMQNVDMTSNIKTELVLLKFISEFIVQMEGNTIKHLDRIIKLISYPIQGEGEYLTKKRLYTLNVLSITIKMCWPVIQLYQQKILKIVLRMLIDLCMLSSRNIEEEKMEEVIYNVLVLMKHCCVADAHETFSSILKINFDSQFDAVHRIIKRVLEAKDPVK